ncbi:Mut7-C RNAse domain-containing protein [Nitrosophilus alvini]|uniref:Mut7-C RNAse domain-containing protein n=1 Tax=Nitrosophilus alvini TaxID=2714855 RepID=UPI001F193ABB|nr:Mut7-C RNAse domain-containing protein [Nitrosophilus alvini]
MADVHLGRTAKYLRLLGFDTLYFKHIEDNDIIDIALRENRTVLTKDRELCKRLENRCFYVNSKFPEDQVKEIVKHFDLKSKAKPFTRCMEDNALLERVDKSDIEEQLPEKVRGFYEDFKICPVCKKIYWLGSHYERMKKFIDSLLGV